MEQQPLNKKVPIIYLAGGFYADNWQDKVINLTQSATNELEKRLSCSFINPKDKERFIHGEWKGKAKSVFADGRYVAWDLNGIDQSDIVFVYIDKENPGIVGALTELGYAKGKGKFVIGVFEKDHKFVEDRYFDFARHTSDVSFDNLEDAAYFLNTFLTQYI